MRHIYYTLQTLLHGRSSDAIKIISLALGLLMSVFLFARIAFELSFDNFYKDADRLYVVQTSWLKDGEVMADYNRFTLIPIPAAVAEEFPEQVEGSTVSCSLFSDGLWLGEEKYELPVVMADTLYFSVLGLEMVEGNPQDLAGADVVFLSARAAREVFGGENPVGKTLQYDFFGEKVPLLVKGIFADVPLNTSLQKRPEAIVSFPSIQRHTQWRQGWQSGGNYDGFLRLRSPKDADWLNERLSTVIARHIPSDFAYELRGRVLPVRSLHLDDSKVRKMVWVMFFLGIVLLFTTTLNYVLISVASLTRRAKAIGVHKCSGASGGSIFSMFMTETLVVTGIALLLIGVLVYLFQEKMEELAAVPLGVLFAWQNLWAPVGVLLLLVLLGGGLPALLFARIPVTQVFRRYTSGRRGWKRVLLFVQFAGAAFILGMLLTVASQYHYVTGRDRGWRPERVVYLRQNEVDSDHLKSALRGQPYVEDLASTQNSLLWFGKNRPVLDNQGNEMFYPRNGWFNTDFLPFIGLKLKEGHNLTGEGQLLVNGAFCRRMQWADSPIGKQVNGCGTVVGLLASFSFPDLPNDEEPVMVEWAGKPGPHLYVRLKEPFEENLARLNEEMRRLYPRKEFLFGSLEQEIRSYSESVRVFRDVTMLVSLTILFIVLMGLVGYVNDEVRLRSKEIAIRKVNGAETGSILWLLSGDVWWLALPSVAAGMFGAYKAGQLWVSQFRDIIPLSVAGYIGVGILLLLFILGCVWIKSWRIANENPVNSIKSE